MKLVLSFLLLGRVLAASEQDFGYDYTVLSSVLGEFIQDWTPEDTEVAADALKHCVELPGLFKEIYGMQEQCTGTTSKMEKLGLQLGTAMMVGKQMVNISELDVPWKIRISRLVDALSPLVYRILTNEYKKQASTLCEHSECIEIQKKAMTSVGHCEAGYICGIMMGAGEHDKRISFSACNSVMQNLVDSVYKQQLGSFCDVEASGSYCPEMLEELLLKDFKCYLEISKAQSCSEPCQSTWHELKAKYPTCSEKWMASTLASQQASLDLTHLLVPDASMPPPRTYDEVCQSQERMCIDTVADWQDDVGYNCEQYCSLSDGRHCAIYGHEDYGMGTAKDVCCCCGGGTATGVSILV
mmetsp:Transcript_17733/g.31029  ORF Transcript_17733/g.31029 Transcript_17733/m.31029 type:complete len:355 (-) Transcript_17733:246-1310(-)|eukprot:CAMPEP_0197692688 /NCGR_PEP_ID=MMETSP1338-20131121/111469_1 /TAXON_ID=43686 ORGANISM="Pelagodinium beii, Strain RCC1491" /NCGR_SAMPLE_ID=MMETSP1338 /ASSEMBLY_ACC=CAM_ASM_000754 /LENGTH=354 /DNA_ID=CAMNT_0043275373 /DNA_START=15 /DNA_END=1079 /DNA_ORIENTATION=+